MKAEDILKLIDAGFTKEEITAMSTQPDQPDQPEEPEQPDQQDQPDQPDQQDQPEQQEQDHRDARIEQMQNQINNLIKQMQKNNLKSASVNILPDDDLEKKTDEAMAELIRPKIKEKEM